MESDNKLSLALNAISLLLLFLFLLLLRLLILLLFIYIFNCCASIHLGLLLGLNDLLSWQHVLLIGLSVLQFFRIKILNAGYELILLLLLLNSCNERQTEIDIEREIKLLFFIALNGS